MASKYLDYGGLSYFWTKVKKWVGTYFFKTITVKTSASSETDISAAAIGQKLKIESGNGILLEGNNGTKTIKITFNGTYADLTDAPIKVMQSGAFDTTTTDGVYKYDQGLLIVTSSSSGWRQTRIDEDGRVRTRYKENQMNSTWGDWETTTISRVYLSGTNLDNYTSAGVHFVYDDTNANTDSCRLLQIEKVTNPTTSVTTYTQTWLDTGASRTKVGTAAWSDWSGSLDTKADKVSGATSGHLAALDANGNLVDSGVSATSAGSDTKVTQSAAITTNGEYPIILGNSTATTEVTGTVNKSANLKYNPSTKALTTGGKVNGLTLTAAATGFTIAGGTTSKTLTVNNTYTLGAACAKGVDTSVAASSTSTNLPTSKAVADAITAAKVAPTLSKDANNNYPQSAEPAADATGNIIATAGWVNTKISDKVTLHDLDGLGYVKTDTNGLIPSGLLPSYVDDVVEAYARSGQTALSSTWLATGSASGTVITPAAGKIYILMADYPNSTETTYAANTQFRWGGSAYIKLNDGGVSAISDEEIIAITNNTEIPVS